MGHNIKHVSVSKDKVNDEVNDEFNRTIDIFSDI